MHIRLELPSDHAAVQPVLVSAFAEQGELVTAMTADLRAELASEGGLAVVAEGGVPVVLLEGSPSYYFRFGFRPGAELGFRKPSLRIPDAASQARLLPAARGRLQAELLAIQLPRQVLDVQHDQRADGAGQRDVERTQAVEGTGSDRRRLEQDDAVELQPLHQS